VLLKHHDGRTHAALDTEHSAAMLRETTMREIGRVALILLLFAASQAVYAQQTRERNLQTCLSGKYPALCNYSLLTPEQLKQAKAAELRENLRVCLTGKYPVLCNHSKLTPEQAGAVRAAERAENLRVCATGKYPALCKQNLLSPAELARVQRAEAAENLRVCMDGRYPALCRHSLLTPEQAKQVSAAEAKAAAARPTRAPSIEPIRPRGGECESGHWIDAIDGDGKIIKLEDGSMWEVSDLDTITTSIWLPISEVVVCHGKIINVDDGESAEVTPIITGGARGPAASAPGYVIEAAVNDETFVINREVFEAKTYCFGFETGDRVKFVSGSPFGACATATLLNLRSGKTCDVWCE
jgi:hypothetical protein